MVAPRGATHSLPVALPSRSGQPQKYLGEHSDSQLGTTALGTYFSKEKKENHADVEHGAVEFFFSF